MTADTESLKRFNEDDAFSFIVETLQKLLRREVELRSLSNAFDVNVQSVADLWFKTQKITEHNALINARTLVSGKFFSAFWTLCLRGVLRPSVRHLAETLVTHAVPGNEYSITERGKIWLLSGSTEPMIMSSGSLLELMTDESNRFGPGYVERAREAVTCFESGAYLACCVMCGAAAEAIFLSLAVAKSGDEELIQKEYNSARGRKYVKDLLERNQPGGLVNELSAGFTLLSYWRDNAAHGAAIQVTSKNARTSLSLLLGLCQTANDRWLDLVANANSTK